MNKLILISLLCLIAFGCSKSSNSYSFKTLEFSFSNTFETSFSIKLVPGDSLYIREHWSSNDIYDSIKSPRSKTNYISKLNAEQLKTLNYLVSKLKLKSYRDEYFDDYVYGSAYSFLIDKDSIKKQVNVHSYKEVPKELDSLAMWLYRLKSQLALKEIDKNLDFKTAKFVNPPPPPPPPSID